MYSKYYKNTASAMTYTNKPKPSLGKTTTYPYEPLPLYANVLNNIKLGDILSNHISPILFWLTSTTSCNQSLTPPHWCINAPFSSHVQTI